ncbi:MAG: YqgE/AlgH family protein [Bacteroidetes bacterium]|nr:YqgE/AlgH family protein [Bacteroidota bacterium]
MITLDFNNKTEPTKGKIIISEPFLDDQFFKRSVVLLVEHNELGTTGFILNKALDVKLHELVPELPYYEGNVFYGGPVNKDQLFFIHTLKSIKDSLTIRKGLYWGGDFEQVKELMQQGKLSDTNIRFFIGYSGWDFKQLEKEIEQKSWIVSDEKNTVLFNENFFNLWTICLKSMGKEYAIMTTFPENPELN